MDDQLRAVLQALAEIKGRAAALPVGPYRDGILTAVAEAKADVYRIQGDLDMRRNVFRAVAAERRDVVGGHSLSVSALCRGRS